MDSANDKERYKTMQKRVVGRSTQQQKSWGERKIRMSKILLDERKTENDCFG